MADAIDTVIAELAGGKYSDDPQNLIARVESMIAALREIQGGLVPAGPEAANSFYGGPTSGAAALPAFRALVNADLPAPLTGTKAANLVFAGPASGAAALPDFRALVAADLAGAGAVAQTIGAWVPADASGAGLVFANPSAAFTQLGNMNFAYGSWDYPVTVNGANAAIGGLPFTIPNLNYAAAPALLHVASLTFSGLQFVGVKNTKTALLFNTSGGGAITNAQLSGLSCSVMYAYPAS